MIKHMILNESSFLWTCWKWKNLPNSKIVARASELKDRRMPNTKKSFSQVQ